MEWEDRLDGWELDSSYPPIWRARTGSRWSGPPPRPGRPGPALRTWYRSGQIPSRLVDGPHGPQRLVPLAMVASRAEASPRLRRRTAVSARLADQAELEIMRHRIDQLELRLAALEQRQPSQ